MIEFNSHLSPELILRWTFKTPQDLKKILHEGFIYCVAFFFVSIYCLLLVWLKLSLIIFHFSQAPWEPHICLSDINICCPQKSHFYNVIHLNARVNIHIHINDICEVKCITQARRKKATECIKRAKHFVFAQHFTSRLHWKTTKTKKNHVHLFCWAGKLMFC